MHRIDGPGATVDNKFTDGDPVGGVQATVVTDDWLNDMQEESISILAAAGIAPVKGTQNQILQAIRKLGIGVVGALRNGRMSVTTASALATFTADEVVVKSGLGSSAWLIPSFSKSINLATTGVGGMDTGTAPASGFVSIYVIYNPTTGASALLACAQATSNGSIYSGTNMPGGYTASALVSSWYTTASSLLGIGSQRDRTIGRPQVQVSSTNATNAPITLSAAIPLNAVACSGWAQSVSAVSGGGTFTISSDANGSGAQNVGISGVGGGTVSNYEVMITTPQTFYLTSANNSTAVSYVTGYSF